MRAHTRQSLTAFYAAGLIALLLASIAVGFCSPRAVAEPTETFPTTLGVAWYPEQWPKQEWDDDLILMEKAHIHVVRVGEFAWSRLEPREGSFDLDWLQEAIDLAGRHGIRTVLGTPTAAPPAWLTAKYPRTLRVRIDGTRDRHGGRQQFNFSDSQYRRLCREVVRRMALRFGNNPNVIGWQLDNEIGEPSFDRRTKHQFENWLQKHYKTVANLNRSWTTSYWSQEYSAWSQISIPVRDGVESGNPGLLLSWRRFVSDTWRSYLLNQASTIRALPHGHQWITTNTIGYTDPYDHYRTEQVLDMGAWDDYFGNGAIDVARNGFAHDLVRGFTGHNFWVMETQPAFVDWAPTNVALRPDDERALVWHDIAHGADAVCFWQWRSALNGQEQYHGVLVGASGAPAPIYSIIQRIGAEVEKAAPFLTGTTPRAEVAMIHSYESRWAIEWQLHAAAYKPVAELDAYYAALRPLTQSVDVVSADADLSRYKLVIAPALNLITAEQAERIQRYVRNGGHLLLTARSGMKDDNNSLWPQQQPGPLSADLGGRVQQFYALNSHVPVEGALAGPNAQASIWAEDLSPLLPDTNVLLRYGAGSPWLEGHPAALERASGNGFITYIGAVLDEGSVDRIVRRAVQASSIAPPEIAVPAGVEASTRYGKTWTVHILVNFSGSSVSVPLPTQMKDVLHDQSVDGITLSDREVAVLAEGAP